MQLNTVTLTNGSHTLTATAQDKLGNVGNASVTVTVANAIPPLAAGISSHPNGSTVSNTIAFSATATANGAAAIATMQFKIDGNVVGIA